MSQKKRGYQQEYSHYQPEATYDLEKRRWKARKILTLLEDNLGKDLQQRPLCGINWSADVITALSTNSFTFSPRVDIDRQTDDKGLIRTVFHKRPTNLFHGPPVHPGERSRTMI